LGTRPLKEVQKQENIAYSGCTLLTNIVVSPSKEEE
jgi:hypothetical protein